MKKLILLSLLAITASALNGAAANAPGKTSDAKAPAQQPQMPNGGLYDHRALNDNKQNNPVVRNEKRQLAPAPLAQAAAAAAVVQQNALPALPNNACCQKSLEYQTAFLSCREFPVCSTCWTCCKTLLTPALCEHLQTYEEAVKKHTGDVYFALPGYTLKQYGIKNSYLTPWPDNAVRLYTVMEHCKLRAHVATQQGDSKAAEINQDNAKKLYTLAQTAMKTGGFNCY